MPSPLSDDPVELLRQAQAGSNEAATRFYELYKKPMLRAIRRRLDSRLRRAFDSDDFVQDAFKEILAKEFAAADFSTPHALLAFVSKTAENKVRDKLRKHLQSQRSSFGHETSLDQLQSAAEIEAPRTEPLDAEDRARLQKEMSKLPPAYRAIMESWLEGHKPADIAVFLAIDVGIVYRCVESTKRKWKNDWMITVGPNMT
jgi:RNA polymerase sigma factor (sigma-70 family)